MEFINCFGLDVLIPQNLFSFPLNIPLSMALTEIISETAIPTIAHHHDFTWERKNLIVNSVEDYISMSCPSSNPNIQHVTINTSGRHQLARRKGVVSEIIPNVMDFESPPNTEPDEYTQDIREVLGIAPDELLVLQPTRVVKRKGIEHAIELVSRLNRKAKLVISHASGDTGYDYENRIREYTKLLGVDTIFTSDLFQENRGMKDGKKFRSP
jgi:glycosyltransferase involved in cell wall biosynthesis